MKVNKRAKKYIRRILECYTAFDTKMELDFLRTAGDLFIFRIDFIPGTTEDKIRNNLRDAQQALELDLFQLHREGKELFFVVAENNAFDNRLLGILSSPSYKEYTKDMAAPYASDLML